MTSILDECTREMGASIILPNCGAAEAVEVVPASVAKASRRNLRAEGAIVRSDPGGQFITARYRESRKVLRPYHEERPRSSSDYLTSAELAR